MILRLRTPTGTLKLLRRALLLLTETLMLTDQAALEQLLAESWALSLLCSPVVIASGAKRTITITKKSETKFSDKSHLETQADAQNRQLLCLDKK